MVRAWGSDDRILLQGPIGTLGYPPQTGLFLWCKLCLLWSVPQLNLSCDGATAGKQIVDALRGCAASSGHRPTPPKGSLFRKMVQTIFREPPPPAPPLRGGGHCFFVVFFCVALGLGCRPWGHDAEF